MKTISKLLSIVLALSMVLALCVAASAETTEVKICDFENADAEFTALFNPSSKNGIRNSSMVSVTSNGGYKGSKGLKYEIAVLSYDATNAKGSDTPIGRTHTASLKEASGHLTDLGWNTTAKVEDNKTAILWFWIDYNVSTVATVTMDINSNQMYKPTSDEEMYSIYTLKAKDDGTNEIVAIPYDTDVNTHGVSITNYNDSENSDDAYLLFKPGFEGWVGLPVYWYGDGKVFSEGSVDVTMVQFILLIQSRNVENHGSVIADLKLGDHYVIDELQFTAGNTYPAAADSVVSGGDTTDEPSKTADPAALVAATVVAVASAAGLVVVLKKKEF